MRDPIEQDVPTSTGNVQDRMRADILMQFVRGAIFAGGIVFGPILFIYAVYVMGTFLPPESKEAQDPTPDSFISSSEEG